MGKRGVPHRKFSKEDKLKIIREHLDGHEAIEALEKKYKIGHSTIANWIRIYIEDGEEALTPHNGNNKSINCCGSNSGTIVKQGVLKFWEKGE